MVKNYVSGPTSPEEIAVIDLEDPLRACRSLALGPLDDLANEQSLHGTFVGGDLLARQGFHKGLHQI